MSFATHLCSGSTAPRANDLLPTHWRGSFRVPANSELTGVPPVWKHPPLQFNQDFNSDDLRHLRRTRITVLVKIRPESNVRDVRLRQPDMRSRIALPQHPQFFRHCMSHGLNETATYHYRLKSGLLCAAGNAFSAQRCRLACQMLSKHSYTVPGVQKRLVLTLSFLVTSGCAPCRRPG